MGWWPSIFGGDKPADPLKQLDPKLREFLEKESPLKYKTNSPSEASTPPQHDPASPSSPESVAAAAAAREERNKPAAPAVPSQSLYQDGRYAHLWKNYRPQSELEAESLTDHDKLMGVLEAYNERKADITKAAMENCADAQEEWVNCMKHGEWKDQVQMCRHQVRRFEKCYTMQSRFLRALGYGSIPGRAADIEDDIQMHADALYQRVLRHEEAVEKAKKDGTPIPVFDPTIPSARGSDSGKPMVQPSEEVRQQWNEQLEKLPESERPAEEAALRADLQAKSDVARSMKEFYESKRKKKDDEPKIGQEKTVGEQLMSLLTGR